MYLEAAELAVPRQGSASITATLFRVNGYRQPVTLTVDRLPDGVTAEPVDVPDNATTATLTFTAARDAPKGVFEVLVYGAVNLAAPLTLQITSPRAGLLDSNFGTGGELEVDTGMASIQQVRVTPSARLIVLGDTGVGRFMTDGTRDPTWNAGKNAPLPTGFPTPTAVVSRNDGKAYIAGQPSLARLNDDGSVDTGFGTIALANTDPVAELGVATPEGDLFALGDATDHFSITKYSSEGVVAGQAKVDIASHDPVHFAIRANEEILAAAGKSVYRFTGVTQDATWTPVPLAANAFDATDTLFAGAHATANQFAIGGIGVPPGSIPIASGTSVSATSILIRDEGIYVGGLITTGGTTASGVVRFSGGAADPTFGVSGLTQGDAQHTDAQQGPAVMTYLTSTQLLTVSIRPQTGKLIFRRYFL
jgi:hypothetical protein